MGMVSQEELWAPVERELGVTAEREFWSDARRGYYVAGRIFGCEDPTSLRWHVLVLQSHEGRLVNSYECAQIEALKVAEADGRGHWWVLMLFSPSGRRLPHEDALFGSFRIVTEALDRTRLSVGERLRRARYGDIPWADDQ